MKVCAGGAGLAQHCLDMLNAEIAAGALHSALLQSFLHRVEVGNVAELSDAVHAPGLLVEVPQDCDVQQAQSAAGAERSRRLSVMCPCGIRLEGEYVEVGTVLRCPCLQAVRVAAPSGSLVAV